MQKEITTEMNTNQTPPGATHWAPAYGYVQYYRRSLKDHLNQVSESWQKLTCWDYWDQGIWKPVEPGFCSRHCKEIS